MNLGTPQKWPWGWELGKLGDEKLNIYRGGSWFTTVTVVLLVSPGIIKAIQLDYSEAHKNLLQAIRKAPQHSGYGFKQTVSTCLFQKQTCFILCVP